MYASNCSRNDDQPGCSQVKKTPVLIFFPVTQLLWFGPIFVLFLGPVAQQPESEATDPRRLGQAAVLHPHLPDRLFHPLGMHILPLLQRIILIIV